MRRYIVFLVLAFCWVTLLHGAPVSRALAGQIASHVFRSHSDAPVQVVSVHTLKWQHLPVIHAVNFQAGGFVLVSADDRVRPILAICEQGRFEAQVPVPAVDWLLSEYSREIHHCVRNQIPATSEIKAEWADWTSPKEWLTACADATPMPSPTPYLPVIVPPLMSTTWNQGCYYNGNCPTDGGGSCGRVWTGCGATAMAQCMKFHSWPATGFGSYSYTPSPYPLQSANFGASTYIFGAMPNNVTSANAEVAKLMSHAGIALDMNYGTVESTCFFSDLTMSFKQYFRYSLSTQGQGKLLYTDPQWDVVLRTELDAGRIVPYNGGPHIWVCDGYQTGPDLYHMNWGWGGTYNGYYAQNNLNPGSLTFSTVSCIVGLKPVGPFEVEGDSAVFGENGGNVTVEVAGDSNWTAVASAGWISVTLTAGTEGYFQPVISTPANPGYGQRHGFVAFARGLMRDTVWVRQAGITPRLSALPTPIAEGAAGGMRTVTVNCDSNWVVTFADPWISCAPGSGVGNSTVNITIAANPGMGPRTGTIVFARGTRTSTVVVNQDGTSAFWCVPVLGPPAAVGAINVQVKSLNRTSGISEGYVLAPDSTILKRDSTYTLRVTFSGSVAPAIWIDWNQDGDFFDVGEAIIAPGGSWYPTFGGLKTVAFPVPATATLGQTRMRVYVKAFPGPTAGPCATVSVGDIEDFNIYIQPSTVLPAGDFVLQVQESPEPHLRWSWAAAGDPREIRILRDEDQLAQTLATLTGDTRNWAPATGLQAGRYQAEAVDANGFLSRSNVVEYRHTVAVAQAVLSPNPVARGNAFLLQFPGEQRQVTLRVRDLRGGLIRQDHIAAASQCYLSTEGWAAGVYVVEVVVGGKVQRLRVVVE